MTGTGPQAAGSATIRVGFKNVLGSNWTQWNHRWASRVIKLERELHGSEGMRASVYSFVEVKGRRERRSLARMLPDWEVAGSRGPNSAYSDPIENRVLDWHEFPLRSTTKQRRTAMIVRYQHAATGIQWTAATAHLSSSGGTTAERAAASRSGEAQELARLCARHDVDVIAADLNNSVVRPHTPRDILAAVGYRDWRSMITVENVDHDSHYEIGKPNPRRGKHLDGFYFGPRVNALEGRLQINEPESSDHLGLVCTVSISRQTRPLRPAPAAA